MKSWFLALILLSLPACRREPTIVIRFEPADLGAKVAVAALATTECKTADDCVLTPAECCDCNHGGKLVATSKAALEKKKTNCKDVMCAQMMSTDPSCAQKPACEAGRCIAK